MSLLTSLIWASTQFQQAMERRQTPSTGPEAAPGKAQAKAMETEPTPGDDRFTPSENNQSDLSRLKARRLAMTDYKPGNRIEREQNGEWQRCGGRENRRQHTHPD